MVNNYSDVGLKALNENMDKQPVFNEYKVATYMCQYFLKTKNRCLHDINQAAKVEFENNMHHHDTMKTIATAYLSIETVLYKRQYIIL